MLFSLDKLYPKEVSFTIDLPDQDKVYRPQELMMRPLTVRDYINLIQETDGEEQLAKVLGLQDLPTLCRAMYRQLADSSRKVINDSDVMGLDLDLSELNDYGERLQYLIKFGNNGLFPMYSAFIEAFGYSMEELQGISDSQEEEKKK